MLLAGCAAPAPRDPAEAVAADDWEWYRTSSLCAVDLQRLHWEIRHCDSKLIAVMSTVESLDSRRVRDLGQDALTWDSGLRDVAHLVRRMDPDQSLDQSLRLAVGCRGVDFQIDESFPGTTMRILSRRAAFDRWWNAWVCERLRPNAPSHRH